MLLSASITHHYTHHHSTLATRHSLTTHSPLVTPHHYSPPLTRRKTQIDLIIIETTGLANPAPVAQTFFADESIKAFCRLDGSP